MKSSKYILDTQLYIRATREATANAALEEFHRARAPYEYMSAVVCQELLAGTRDEENRRKLESDLVGRFARVGRVVTPSLSAWKQSGELLAVLWREEGLELNRVSKSFANDVLIALSCREAGCVLVTENQKDFARIQRYVPFEFVAPWP